MYPAMPSAVIPRPSDPDGTEMSSWKRFVAPLKPKYAPTAMTARPSTTRSTTPPGAARTRALSDCVCWDESLDPPVAKRSAVNAIARYATALPSSFARAAQVRFASSPRASTVSTSCQRPSPRRPTTMTQRSTRPPGVPAIEPSAPD
jgi:hypothetical protein